MKRIWPFIYFAVLAAAFIGGTEVFSKAHGYTNVDWVFVAVSLFFSLIFPSLAIIYARSRTAGLLVPASLLRGFLGGWWTDPLQCLRLMTLLLCGNFLGSLFTLSHADPQGIMFVWWKAAMAFGFALGELAALKKFRRNIA